jgi:tetratricopeptide (TPR) repeat protein
MIHFITFDKLSLWIWFVALVITLAVVSMAGADTDNTVNGDRQHAARKARLTELKKVLDEDPDVYAHLKEAGILAFNLALQDPKGYAAQAVEWLTRAHEMDKLDDETLCYLGSATSLMARTTRNPFKMTAYVNRGCGYMDKAVRRSPDNITVRMTRAANSKSLPGFLNRRSFAFEDYEYLVGRFEKDSSISAGLKHTVYSNLAELYRNKGEDARADHYRELAWMHQ